MIISTVVVALIALLWAFFVLKTYKVVKVLDGDTIVVSRFGFENKIRLWLIDAPESDQLFGAEATKYLTSKILNKRVFLRIEGKSYDRSVAKVIRPIWGDVAVPMLKRGLAHVDERFIKDTKDSVKKSDMDLYVSLYRKAIDNRKGLFNHTYILPSVWREKVWKVETPVEAQKVEKEAKNTTSWEWRKSRVVVYMLRELELLKNHSRTVKRRFFYKKGDALPMFDRHQKGVLTRRKEAYRLAHEERYLNDENYRHNYDAFTLIKPLANKMKEWGYYD